MGINKINITNLENWNKGDPLEARKFQQPVNALKALAGVTPPSQKINFGRSTQMKMFKVVSLDTDVIICNTFNGIESGSDKIKVALPFLLRETPFDGETRAGIEYSYTSSSSRTASRGEDEESQVIVDSYEEDDIIFAMKGIFGNTAVYHDDPANESPVIWQDMNLDGRYWAKVFEE